VSNARELLPIYQADAWPAESARGRALFTTTVYNLGWLKTEFHDKAKAGDPSIELIQFDSTQNPAFPAEEFEEQRTNLPVWKFAMRYQGLYSRPAGLIYDSYKDYIADAHGAPGHLVQRFALDPKWQRYMGLDFGGVNTAALFYAE
jgi:hypothetical protein